MSDNSDIFSSEDDDDAVTTAVVGNITDDEANFDDEFGLTKDISPLNTHKSNSSRLVDNQLYDETVEITDDDSLPSTRSPAPQGSTLELTHQGEQRTESASSSRDASVSRILRKAQTEIVSSDIDTARSSKNSDDGDNKHNADKSRSDHTAAAEPPKAYDANDYTNLKVSNEVRQLFNYITRYEPREFELDTDLAPFVPEYIPAVGEVDAFLKVSPPDANDDGLGFRVLDEPCANQSDPTVLELQLRVVSKHSGMAMPITVRNIENADKHPKKVSAWISSIEEIHRQKPAPTVSYSRIMPDVDELMQVWPSDFERVLNSSPGLCLFPDIDMSVEDLARTVCALLDAPVYASLKESLHLIFSLYLEFTDAERLRNEANTTKVQ